VFTDREGVVFTLKALSEQSVSLRVSDYFGKTIVERALLVKPEKTLLDLGRMSTGYFELHLGSQIVSFAVVPAGSRRFKGEDSPLATDGAISWLVAPEHFKEAAQLMKRAGVLWVRDRLHWGEVQPERDRFQWGKYDKAADAQVKAGLKVYQIFHDTAAWTRSDRDGRRYPDDLRDVYRFTQEAARHFKGRVHAWEVWNEADIPGFSPEPADPYAAFFKAASLGFKSVDPQLQVLMVSMALGPGHFTEALFENGIAPYMDIYNWHIYDAPQNYHLRAEKHLDLMARHGVQAPNWLTEAGIPLEATNGGLTPTDQRRQAEFVPKSFAYSLACGVMKHFFFVFPYYLENGIDFGLLHKDLTPYPGYAALSATTYALGKGIFLGRIRREGIQAFLFDNGKGQTLVLWSDEGGKDISLSVKARSVRLVNVVGGEERLPITRRKLHLQLTPSPVFLMLPPDILQETIIPPEPLPKPVRQSPAPAYKEIVARLVFPKERIDKHSESYILPAEQETPVALEVYNFSEQPFQGKAQISLPEGWQISGILPTLSIDPMGRVSLRLPLKAAPQPSSERKPIRVQVSGSKGEASPCVAYVQAK